MFKCKMLSLLQKNYKKITIFEENYCNLHKKIVLYTKDKRGDIKWQ